MSNLFVPLCVNWVAQFDYRKKAQIVGFLLSQNFLPLKTLPSNLEKEKDKDNLAAKATNSFSLNISKVKCACIY